MYGDHGSLTDAHGSVATSEAPQFGVIVYRQNDRHQGSVDGIARTVRPQSGVPTSSPRSVDRIPSTAFLLDCQDKGPKAGSARLSDT